jgi:prepilin-type N-terminal cleavage/methylation domain-containing protein
VSEEGGYTMFEMLIVLAIMSIVMGGIVTMFTAGIRSDSAQSSRFRAQQDTKVALDLLRRDIHTGCTIAAPSSYNTWLTSVTLYTASDACVAGTHSVSWCTVGSGTRYGLYRIAASTCSGATAKVADYLTSASVFVYLPPNSHLVSSTSLGQGTSPSYVATADGSSSLPRLHVDLNLNRTTKGNNAYRLVDDIALRGGPRACLGGTATC